MGTVHVTRRVAEPTKAEGPESAAGRPWRVTVAAVLVVAMFALSLLYHDGIVDADTIESVAEDQAQYRLRGTVVRVEGEFFELRDPTGTLRIQWNLTDPGLDRAVVVVGVYNASAQALDGDAVVGRLLL